MILRWFGGFSCVLAVSTVVVVVSALSWWFQPWRCCFSWILNELALVWWFQLRAGGFNLGGGGFSCVLVVSTVAVLCQLDSQ